MSKKLPSSEDMTNFYSKRHSSTCILYTPGLFPEKCRSWYELVKVLEILSKLVKATFSLHYHYTLIYENYSKNKSQVSTKFTVFIIAHYP